MTETATENTGQLPTSISISEFIPSRILLQQASPLLYCLTTTLQATFLVSPTTNQRLSIQQPTMRPTPSLKRTLLEVERKFTPTPLSVSHLRSNTGRVWELGLLKPSSLQLQTNSNKSPSKLQYQQSQKLIPKKIPQVRPLLSLSSPVRRNQTSSKAINKEFHE